MYKSILILLLAPFAITMQAQSLSKVVVSKFENGNPKLVNHYAGSKTAENLRKQETFNVDGRIVLEKNFKNTLLDGPVKEFKEFDGSPINELNYKKGKLDGSQYHYFSDGRVKFALNYLNGVLNGTQREYFFKEHTIRSETNYSGGVLHGMQQRWNQNGTKAYHYNFVAGKPDGIQRTWTESGLVEERWVQGQLEDIREKWSAVQAKEVGIYTYENKGDSLNITLGKKLEKEIRYYDSGSIQAIQIPGDPPMLKEFHPDGKVKGEGRGTFASREGKWEFFHQNGNKMMSGEYANGKKMGVFQYWDEKGRLVEEEVWNSDGTRRESWTVTGYHWNDKKEYEGSLTPEGWKIGIWKYWYELGERKIEENWKTICSGSDRPVLEDYTEWTKSGKVLRKGNEREQLEYAYHENGEVKTITTMLFFERDPCQMDQPTRYIEGGTFEKKATDPRYFKSVNTLVITLTDQGDSLVVDRYNKNGQRDGIQEGWYPKGGNKRYSIHFLEGRVQGSVKEWYPSGSLKLDHKYHSDQGGGPFRLVEGTYYNEKGKDFTWNAAEGKDKKKVMLEIEDGAYFFEFMEMNPNE